MRAVLAEVARHQEGLPGAQEFLDPRCFEQAGRLRVLQVASDIMYQAERDEPHSMAVLSVTRLDSNGVPACQVGESKQVLAAVAQGRRHRAVKRRTAGK